MMFSLLGRPHSKTHTYTYIWYILIINKCLPTLVEVSWNKTRIRNYNEYFPTLEKDPHSITHVKPNDNCNFALCMISLYVHHGPVRAQITFFYKIPYIISRLAEMSWFTLEFTICVVSFPFQKQKIIIHY